MEAPIRSPAGDPGAPRDNRRAGYVLIDMVATLAVTMLMLSFVFPFAPLGTTPSRLLALVSASASVLREARTAAMAEGRPVAARFDAVNRTLRAGAGLVTFPADVDVTLTAGGHCPARDGAAAILFRPDGTNCGGILRFGRAGRVLRARVNWVDGHIDVVEGG